MRTILKQKERIVYFDVLRAIAVFFVIAIHTFNRIPGVESGGHFTRAAALWRIAISCAVPVFLAVSGYFMALKKVDSADSYKKFLKKQIPRVYIPCLIWSIPYFYWEVKNSGMALKELFYLLFCGYSVYYFVFLIIIFYLLLPLLQRTAETKKGLFFSIALSIVFKILWTVLSIKLFRHDPPLIYSAFFFPMWMMFFVVGLYYGKGKKVHINDGLLIALLLLSILFTMAETSFLTSRIDNLRSFPNIIGTSVYSFIVILLFLNHIPKQSGVTSVTSRLICYIGRISYGIYLIHMYVLLYYDVFRTHCFPGFQMPFPLLIIMIFMVSILLISVAKMINNRLAIKYLGF